MSLVQALLRYNYSDGGALTGLLRTPGQAPQSLAFMRRASLLDRVDQINTIKIVDGATTALSKKVMPVARCTDARFPVFGKKYEKRGSNVQSHELC